MLPLIMKNRRFRVNHLLPQVMISPQNKSQSCKPPKSNQKLKVIGRRMFLSKNSIFLLLIPQRLPQKYSQTLITRFCTAVPFPPSTPCLPPPPPPHWHPCPPPLPTKRPQHHPLLLLSLTALLLQANFKGVSLHFSRTSPYLKWNKSCFGCPRVSLAKVDTIFWNMMDYMPRDGSGYQNGWFFGKMPRGGGGSFSI